MSSTTLSFQWLVNNVLTDATAVTLNDPTSAFGVRRTDTSAIVEAAGTVMNHDATGQYSFSFIDPAAGLTYEYWVQVVYQGATYRLQRFSGPAAATNANSYLTSGAADALAAQIPTLRAWPSATTQQKTAALYQATLDIDRGQIYQGRKYDTCQALQFPRVAYETFGLMQPWDWIDSIDGTPVLPPGWEQTIWDWDRVNSVAIVPNNVLLAVLYQADSILVGDREERLASQHDGVASQGNSGLQESYRPRDQNPGFRSGLCRRSYQLMELYRIRAGRML